MGTLHSSLVLIKFNKFMNNQNIHKNPIGISLPEDIIQEIDTQRGDVARSRYILRLIEASLKQEKYQA